MLTSIYWKVTVSAALLGYFCAILADGFGQNGSVKKKVSRDQSLGRLLRYSMDHSHKLNASVGHKRLKKHVDSNFAGRSKRHSEMSWVSKDQDEVSGQHGQFQNQRTGDTSWKEKISHNVVDLLTERKITNTIGVKRSDGADPPCGDPIQISPNPMTIYPPKQTGMVNITCPRQTNTGEIEVDENTQLFIQLQFKRPNASDFEGLGYIYGGWNNRSLVDLWVLLKSFPFYKGAYGSGTYKTGGITITLNQTACRHDQYEFRCSVSITNNGSRFTCSSSAVFRVESAFGQLSWSRNPDKPTYVIGEDSVTLTCATSSAALKSFAWLWEYRFIDEDDSAWRYFVDIAPKYTANECLYPSNHSVVTGTLRNQRVCERVYRCSLVILAANGLVETRLLAATLPSLSCTRPNGTDDKDTKLGDAGKSWLSPKTHEILLGLSFGFLGVCIIVAIGVIIYAGRGSPSTLRRRSSAFFTQRPPPPPVMVVMLPGESTVDHTRSDYTDSTMSSVYESQHRPSFYNSYNRPQVVRM